MKTIDLSSTSVRVLNQSLHGEVQDREWRVTRPDGKHNLAVGISEDVSVEIDGHAGYYCAGMNQKANITVHGNVGVGVAENMMSGSVRVKGSASQAAGATAHGGLLVIEGDAGARCGISMKGVDIVVGGSIGHMSCFMGQAGRLVVCGDAGDALGDSLYEVRIYVKGTVQSLGSDCIEKEMRAEHLQELQALLNDAGLDHKAADFKRYGSARQLYNFKVDNASAY
ncbi:protein glxC [Pseudomonas kermanshahensis]|uniref:GltB/FmdC/FwdC-like GXGXG domain-containing protein n=1 Tax=Pseudomonas kermanshahensis TaxID=2745482 RepID=UPI0023DAC9AE|nr:protein glxC [Pseudomonas kermanshahensis]WEL53400.1 protein glxC [Pseudomonas kermanshahensis]